MGVAEDVEVFFPVGVAVAGVVGADGFAFEGVAGGLVEAGGEGVGEGVGVGVFEEGAVWGAFAGCHETVTVVDKDFHSSSSLRWNKMKIGQCH